MIITPVETFVASLAFAGAAGARRGVHREVITCAVVLSDVLFLSNGGGAFLAHVLGGVLGGAASAGTALGGPLFAGGGGGGGGTAPAGTGAYPAGTGAYPTDLSTCTLALTNAISNITFICVTWLGYRAGTRFGPPAKLPYTTLPGLCRASSMARLLRITSATTSCPAPRCCSIHQVASKSRTTCRWFSASASWAC